MSQAALARLLGKSQPTVQRWEAGIHLPRRSEIRRISEITNGEVTANDFHAAAPAEGAHAA